MGSSKVGRCWFPQRTVSDQVHQVPIDLPSFLALFSHRSPICAVSRIIGTLIVARMSKPAVFNGVLTVRSVPVPCEGRRLKGNGDSEAVMIAAGLPLCSGLGNRHV